MYNIYKLFFVLVGYKIVTLAYDHGYLQLLMLNNGKSKMIYDYYKLVFLMVNYTMIT